MAKTYWKQKNGKLIDIDTMDIKHLRNTLKMIVRNNEYRKSIKEDNESYYDDSSMFSTASEVDLY